MTTPHMRQPITDMELVHIAEALIRMCRTERTRYWGVPRDNADGSLPAPVWKQHGWKLSIVKSDDCEEYRWRHIIAPTVYDKLYLFGGATTVRKTVLATRDRSGEPLWYLLVIHLSGRVLRSVMTDEEMGDDAIARIRTITTNHPHFIGQSRSDFLATFGDVYLHDMATEIRQLLEE